jgi:hypothetical protein
MTEFTKEERRVRLLARSHDGCTEALMMAQASPRRSLKVWCFRGWQHQLRRPFIRKLPIQNGRLDVDYRHRATGDHVSERPLRARQIGLASLRHGPWRARVEAPERQLSA